MRTNIVLIVTLLSLASCGGEKTLEERKAELEAKKVELAKLQNEVNRLEQELLAEDPSLVVKEDNGILVAVEQIEPQPFNHFFQVNGSIEAIEQANISPEQGGQIEKILVNEGDRVSAGAVLVQLNTSIIEANLEELDNSIELAQTIYDRQARLWEKNIGSEIQYLEAKNRLENLQKKREALLIQMDKSKVKAPFSGVVDAVHQKEGELASPGMPLITSVNTSELKVKADVSENYVLAVKEGATVDVDFPSFGYSVRSNIKWVSRIINPSNRTFSVEVRVPNKNGILKPNGIAVLKIKDFEADSALVVPSRCVGKDANGDFLFVIETKDGKTIAAKRYVTIGRTSNGKTMILSGLQPGEKVVVDGYNEVANGDPVNIQNQ